MLHRFSGRGAGRAIGHVIIGVLRAAHDAARSALRRAVLARPVRTLTVAATLSFASTYADAAPLVATRFWPAEAYTRLTLEAAVPLAYRLAVEEAPPRVVLEIDDLDAGPLLDTLPARVAPTDPYVAALRVTRPSARTARLVFDLKTATMPQAFLLKPVGDYGHRLVLDFYPVRPTEPDPLLALLRERDGSAAAVAAATAIARTPPIGSPAGAATAAAAGTTPATPLREPPNAQTGAPSARSIDTTPSGAISPPPTAGAAGGTAARDRGATAAVAGDKPPGQPIATTGTTTRPFVVAIDAGHGGEDPGARGAEGTFEKHVTLAIARKLKAALDEDPAFAGVLVRDGDYFIPLHQRVVKARAVRADLFVSIHADAFVKPHARGSSVFALSEGGATSAAARWLAKKENEADLIGGVNIDVADPILKRVLLDLSQTAQIADSKRLARALLAEIGAINTLHKRHVEQAGFAVLKAPDIPSVLIETAFISNPEEEARLADEDYQWTMARAIANGIHRYAAKTRNNGRAVATTTASASASAPASQPASAPASQPATALATISPATPGSATATPARPGIAAAAVPVAARVAPPAAPVPPQVAEAASPQAPVLAAPSQPAATVPPSATAAAPPPPRATDLRATPATLSVRTTLRGGPGVPASAVQRAALARAAGARVQVAALDAPGPNATPPDADRGMRRAASTSTLASAPASASASRGSVREDPRASSAHEPRHAARQAPMAARNAQRLDRQIRVAASTRSIEAPRIAATRHEAARRAPTAPHRERNAARESSSRVAATTGTRTDPRKAPRAPRVDAADPRARPATDSATVTKKVRAPAVVPTPTACRDRASARCPKQRVALRDT